MGAEGLQALDLGLMAPGDDPTDPHPRRKRLGKAGTVDDTSVPIIGLERLVLALVEHQFAIDIVLDDLDVETRRQAQQLLLPVVRHAHAQRITQARGQHQGLDRPLPCRKLQRLKAHSGIRVAGDLDDLQSEQIGQLKQAVIGRRLGGDEIARLGQDPQ